MHSATALNSRIISYTAAYQRPKEQPNNINIRGVIDK